MIIGDTAIFAIESNIAVAYEDVSLRALGFFLLHIQGRSFGVREHDATLLACSYDEVERRLARRGQHTAPFASEPVGSKIIDAIREAIYAPSPTQDSFFGLSTELFNNYVYSSHCEWHRLCDEAFDDGSSVLHFDVGDMVRLIADTPSRGQLNWMHDPATLTEVWLKADDFYGVLEGWHDAFHREWTDQKGAIQRK